MNAVEAARHLIELGRQVQRQEGRLRQPVAALQFPALGEPALADPLASLAALLAAASGAPSTPGATGARSPGARPRPASWQTSVAPAAPPPASPATASVAPSAFVAFPPLPDASPASEGRGAFSSPAHPAGQGLDSPSSPASVRLARRQSSLLGILRANAGEGGAVAAQETGERPTPGTAAGLWAAQAGGLPGGDPPLPTAGGGALPPDASQSAWGWAAALPAGETAGLSWSPAQDGAPTAATPGLSGNAMPAESGGGARLAAELADELDVEPDAALAPSLNFWPQRQEAGAAQDRMAGGSVHGGALPAPGSPAVGAGPSAADDPWPAAPDGRSERPLSEAQIEQVLAALDERLALLLLRTYGTSAGA